MDLLQGTWKRDGFVFAVPAALRPSVKVIRVHGARAQVLSRNPAVFYVIVPKTVPDADKWRVGVTRQGALRITPPEGRRRGVANIASGHARVGMQVGALYGDVNVAGGSADVKARATTVGLAVPRDFSIHDQL